MRIENNQNMIKPALNFRGTIEDTEQMKELVGRVQSLSCSAVEEKQKQSIQFYNTLKRMTQDGTDNCLSFQLVQPRTRTFNPATISYYMADARYALRYGNKNVDNVILCNDNGINAVIKIGKQLYGDEAIDTVPSELKLVSKLQKKLTKYAQSWGTMYETLLKYNRKALKGMRPLARLSDKIDYQVIHSYSQHLLQMLPPKICIDVNKKLMIYKKTIR